MAIAATMKTNTNPKTMMELSSAAVIIPTRSSPEQSERLERAIYTIYNQPGIDAISLSVYLGIDPDTPLPRCPEIAGANISYVTADFASQASALNAAIKASTEDIVIFLEDDDFWEPGYLSLILNAYGSYEGLEMTTSNQLEVNDAGDIIRINDFPTPSTWSLTRIAIEKIGLFDETYQYHLDNEYLGRASSIGINRLHLLERTAPITRHGSRHVRPWIHNILTLSGGSTLVARHNMDSPYVIRVVHDDSRSREAVDKKMNQVSTAEYERLRQEYGHIPW